MGFLKLHNIRVGNIYNSFADAAKQDRIARNMAVVLGFLTLHNMRPLSENIKFIGTRCEQDRNDLFLKLVHIILYFLTMYVYCLYMIDTDMCVFLDAFIIRRV